MRKYVRRVHKKIFVKKHFIGYLGHWAIFKRYLRPLEKFTNGGARTNFRRVTALPCTPVAVATILHSENRNQNTFFLTMTFLTFSSYNTDS